MDQTTLEALKVRSCNTCGEPLHLNAAGTDQTGVYCCDGYYHEGQCLDSSFDGTTETWESHYNDDGDCYFTEWPLTEIVADYLAELQAA